MENLEKILEIKVDVGQAIQGIANLNKIIDEQRAYQKALREEIKRMTEAEGENSDVVIELQNAYVLSQQKVKDYQSPVAGLSKTVQNQLKIEREQIGSNTQLRAQLSNLTKAYDELSKEEKEAAQGVELKNKINEVTDALKNSEEATQRYYRNVGNYENAIKNSLGLNSKFGQTLQNVAEVTRNGVGPALKETATATANVGKQMLKLLANPIVAFLAGVALAVMAVVKGIKSSEENTAKLSKVTAAFRPVLDVITKGFQAFASVVLDVVGWIGKLTNGVMKWLEKAPLIGDNIKAINAENERYNKIADDKYKLDQRNRDLEVESAKVARDVAELRTKAKDKEKYTDEERLAFVQEANKLEKQIADEKKAAAEERLRILQEEAKATANTKEINDEIAKATAEVYRAETEYNTKIRELLEQENTIKNEILAKDKAREDEAEKQNEKKKKQQKEYNDALKDAYEETQDMLIELLEEGAIKEEELERTRYERHVQAIKDKQSAYDEDTELYKEYTLQLELAAQQHAANMQQIGIDQRLKEAEERALDWENRILEAELNGEDYKALTLEMLQDQIDSMYQLQGESDAEFYNRKLQAQIAYKEEKKKQDDEEVALERAKVSAIASITGSLSSILETTAGNNKKRLKAAKVLALAEVTMNQGLAIAKATQAAAGFLPPLNVIMMASSGASAMAAIAPAIQAVKSVKFARGGYVSGAGTSTSDSIPAMLSNGEFVVNAKATSMFPDLLETINNLGLGIAAPARAETVVQRRQEIDSRDSLIKAIESMPNPVVSVEEIDRTGKKVKAVENLSRLS